MESQIQTYVFSRRNGGPVTLFGYATKSLPGLEINGLGRYGKTLKEKVVFITRSRNLPVPLKRYVISAEYEVEQDPEGLRWMDVPVLMLYWHMAGLVRMGRLDNCVVAGQVSPAGEILVRQGDEVWSWAASQRLTLLGNYRYNEPDHVRQVHLADVLAGIPELKFTQFR